MKYTRTTEEKEKWLSGRNGRMLPIVSLSESPAGFTAWVHAQDWDQCSDHAVLWDDLEPTTIGRGGQIHMTQQAKYLVGITVLA